MDATRTEPAFVYQILEAVIDAGATTVNIPDTVGYAMPADSAISSQASLKMSRTLRGPWSASIVTMTSAWPWLTALEAVKRGARQVEGTINGIGERAGNAALEEIVMAIKTRGDLLQSHDGYRYHANL